ncbi:hypothetical protein JCM10207_000959 [Rhodosporidiobolus poonsookiae]
MPAQRTLFHQPTPEQVEAAPDTRFRLFLNERLSLDLKDFFELSKWALDNLNEFWSAVWDFCGIIGDKTEPNGILFDDSKPMPEFNPDLIRAKLNYAENMLLSHPYARSSHRALLSVIEPTGTSTAALDAAVKRSLSFEELYQEVRVVAHTLRTKFGVKPGDRVATFSPSNAEAIIFCLATLAVGGVWSSSPSEFGVRAVLERLEQIEPKVLLSADFYKYNGKEFPIYPKLQEILARLPSVENVVIVGQLQKDREPKAAFPQDPRAGRKWWSWNQVVEQGQGAPKEIEFHRGSAMNPVWVLYSSGTTGKPKAIVHSVGGMVLSQKMVHTLHNSVGPGDSQMTFSTLGWMMWNHMVGALANGVCVIAYDGSPFAPCASTFFALAEHLKISVLGLSPRFLSIVAAAGYSPKTEFDLSHVKQIELAGSVLEGYLYDWMRDNIQQNVWVNNGTGGTDICNLFIGAVESLPIYHGELTTIILGMDLQAWDEKGDPLLDEQGDMVIRKPFPNMPIGFLPLNEEGQSRYRAAYYDAYPHCDKPVWTHGDYIEISSETGGVTMFGRSDGVLNPGGVRFGSSEIYAVVEKNAGVEDCLAIGQKLADGDERFILFVKPKASPLSPTLVNEIKLSIRTLLSPRHVPAKIVEVSKIPYTTNGKRLEVPTKKLVNGVPYANLNLSAAEDPECLKIFVNHPELVLPLAAVVR